MGWVWLAMAIASELMGSLALKASDGMSRLLPAGLVVVGYGAAFTFLSLALRTIGLGPAYATWSGIGTVGAAVGAYLVFGERVSPLTVVGIGIVVVGVVVMQLGGSGETP
jgi:small multidrug resistance pump